MRWLTNHRYRDINAVIMDYLLSEGYPDAASKFSKEANIEPQLGIQTIDDRVAIRNFIMAGEVESAIERINDFNPQVRYSFFLSVPLSHDYTVSCTTHSFRL
jgi:hypothetical protein